MMRAKFPLFLAIVLIAIFVFSNFGPMPRNYALPAVASYYPSGYNMMGSTAYISGSLANLQSDDGVYMTFGSYPSATSSQSLYAHQETTTISGTNYRTLKISSADASGTSLSASMASTGRTLLDKFTYPLTGILSIPASTWTFYYRAWKDSDQSIAYDAASSTTLSTAGSSMSWTHTTGSGNNRFLIVAVGIHASSGTPTTVTNVTYGGTAMTQETTDIYSATTPQIREYTFILINPASGSNTIKANFAASTTAEGGSVSYTGVDQTTPIQSAATNKGSGTSESASVTVSGSNRWVFGHLACYRTSGSYTITDGSGQNRRWGQTSQLYKGVADDKSSVSSGSVSMSWTTTSTVSWVVSDLAINPASPIGIVDSDILIRKSDNTVRATIATSVAGSGTLTTSAATLSGAYSWAAYTVVSQTDYLEIDYYADVTGADQAMNTYLRIDDSSLATASQTRVDNVFLPTQYVMEVEFTGSSDINYWSQLVWTIDSAWTISNVTVILQVYNYTLGSYPTSGNGYISYVSIATPNTDETKNQTITKNPTNFRDSSGNWKIKVKGVKSTTTQFNFEADLVRFQVTGDTTPPVWSNAGTNNTNPGQPTRFYVKWVDNVALSGYIFGTNNTGAWVNNTWASMIGTSNWSNTSKILNSVGGTLIQWRVWANDTSNNWNNTGLMSLRTNQPPVASFTFSPTAPYTSQTVTSNASASYDPDGTVVGYSWTFGDGANSTGKITTHAYAHRGVYTITLVVTDGEGLTNTCTQRITVLDRPPVASFTTSAASVLTGTAVYFNASCSYDPDGVIVGYFWTFDDGKNATGLTASHAYSQKGVYNVTLIVTDNDGSIGTSASTITVLDRPPVASFTKSAATVYKSDVVYFNASASYDPDGSIVSYFWTFGDGKNASGVTVSNSYANVGTYAVTLTVTDNDGSTASAMTVETVLDRPPVASFTESAATVYTRDVIYFNASASYDPDGVIVSCFWTFGDGTNATGLFVSHAYVDNGMCTVTLIVTDNDGSIGTSASTITVLDRPPVASFTESATSVLTGTAVYFNASASYDPDGTVVSYFWTFGDGSNVSGVAVSHGYAVTGVYNVTLTVKDNDGSTASASATVTVLDRPPIATFTESASAVYTGQSITFNASLSYDPDGSIVSYFWTFGDNTNASGVLANRVWAKRGNYTITLTVKDNDGSTGTANTIVTVLDRPPLASFIYSPTPPIASRTVTFDASKSNDPDGIITSYRWDFGDGNITTVTSPVTTHIFNSFGNYTVTLIVVDNDGNTNATTQIVSVIPLEYPIASFTYSPSPCRRNVTTTFDATSSDPHGGTITSYVWNFGDGNTTTVTTPIITHVFKAMRIYNVELTVTDSKGLSSSVTKPVITVSGLVGDVNGDGKVDIHDVAMVVAAFGSLRINDPTDPRYGQYWHPTPRPGDPCSPYTDINGDGKVDIQDVARVCANFGKYITASSATTGLVGFQKLFETLPVILLALISTTLLLDVKSLRRKTMPTMLRRRSALTFRNQSIGATRCKIAYQMVAWRASVNNYFLALAFGAIVLF
jgi:PKD repeat protein